MNVSLTNWARRILAGHADEDVVGSAQLAGLSIGEALQSHSAWIQRFEEALKDKRGQKLDAEQVSHDDRCVLGKWLYAQDTQDRFKRSSEFMILQETHSAFHRNASLVISALRHDDKDEAQILLDMVKAKSRQIRVSLAKLC